MRLVQKLVLAISLGFLPVVATLEFVEIRREVGLLESDTVRHLRLLGRVLQHGALPGGEDWALRALEGNDDAPGRTSIRWIPAGESQPPPDPSRVSVRLPIEGVVRGEVELSRSREPLREFARTRAVRSTVLAGALLGVAVTIAFALGNRMVGVRLAQLVEQARRVGAGDLAGRVRIGGRDEITLLGKQMNAMTDELAAARAAAESANAERVQALSQLRHADRLASIGRLASVLAHELGTPLNVVLGRAKLVAEDGGDRAQNARNAEIIREQAQRMVDTIRSVLGFARQTGGRALLDLVEVARECVAMLEPLARRRGINFVLRVPDGGAALDARRSELVQVVTNLLTNAIDAMDQGGEIELTIETVASRGKREVLPVERRFHRLGVRDHGHGIPHEEIGRLFEPFYTTKPEGGGTGLGLWIVDGIVRDHGGWIDVESRVGSTCFSVYLPVEEPR